MMELTTHLLTPKILNTKNIEHRNHYRSCIGTETTNLLQTCDIIKREILTGNSSKPHISWQLVYGFVKAISTVDPNPLHFTIARSALAMIDPELIDNKNAVDLLARHLNDVCNKLKSRFCHPKQFHDFYVKAKVESDAVALEQNIYNPSCFEILEFSSKYNEIESVFEIDGMFLQDSLFLKTLANTGEYGTFLSNEIKNHCIQRLENYKSEGKTPLGFWFNLTPKTSSEHLFLSPSLQTLAGALWEDVVKRLVHFSTHQVPALSTNVHEPIIKLLSPKNEITHEKGKIQIYNQQTLVGGIPVAVVHKDLLDIIIRGAEKLNTVTAHRLMRYLPQKAFEQMARGDFDFRVIIRKRGATEIAEELGLRTNKAITEIKELLHAMQHFEFASTDSVGHLIALEKKKSPITHRMEMYEITVGTALLPYQTFNAYKNGECGLLIPILPDPILVGANQFHSAQYLFQMYIAGEFSKNSHVLCKEGAIPIMKEKREEFAKLCGLTPELLSRVWELYTSDGDETAKFLEKVSGEFYTLGKSHQKSLEFLKRQGQLRITQSHRGKKSAMNRAKSKSKGKSQRKSPQKS